MSTTINIINNFSVEIDGIPYIGKQGSTDGAITDSYGITITGDAYVVPFTLVGSAIKTLWDEDSNYPADYAYVFIWADTDMYIQVIGQASQFSFKQLAKVPWVMTYGKMLAAANTTPLAAEPTVTDVDSLLVLNPSSSLTVRGLIGLFN